MKRMKALLLALLCIGSATAQVLHTAAEVRALSEAEAEAGRAVEIQGVVTWDHRPASEHIIVQDRSGAIYVQCAKDNPWPNQTLVGKQVRLTGKSAMGGVSPLVMNAVFGVQGQGQLPPAAAVRYEDILTGRYDCQRVEIEAIVERGEEGKVPSLKLSTHVGGFGVGLSGWESWKPARYEDARLKVTGCVLSLVNNRKELLGFRLMVAQAADLQVLAQPSPEPFAAPLVPLPDLRQQSSLSMSLHRQRMRGRVTHSALDGSLWIEDAGHALRCEVEPGQLQEVGAEVEVSGFLRLRDHFASLAESKVKLLGPAIVMTPTEVGPQRVAKEDWDGRFISMQGVLRKIAFSPQQTQFYLETDGVLTEARLYGQFPRTKEWQEGAELRLTGIARVRLEPRRHLLDQAKFGGFHLHLRGQRDVMVIKPVSWWTAERLAQLGVALAVLLAAVLGWAALLRAQVSRRTQQLAAEIEAKVQTKTVHEATLRERNRLAADLHDTVAQSFTAVGFQLQAARVHRAHDEARAEEHLRLAVELLEHGSQDLRRSLHDLRARVLEGMTLSMALRHTTKNSSPPVEIHVDAASETLPDFLANQLLHFAQEAVSNAVRHAEAKCIRVTVVSEAAEVVMRISDDGRGFDLANAKGPAEGHFGLTGMKERALRIGGQMELTSSSQGTQVTLRVREPRE
jgi:signal transduction histidine kinase